MEKMLQAAFAKKFASLEKNSYDKNEQLVYETISGRNYHTALTSGRVHRTRENTEFAIGLLQSGSPENVAAAAGIFRKILALQDTNPQSATYGVWPYLLEEPLDKMLNPDWNWASFISRTLIIALIDFKNLLPSDLQQEMKRALDHACISIQRRNMGVDYTNICIMSSFVIAVAGELLEREAYVAFGLDKLQRLVEFIALNGSISEYNSPYYGVIDLEENGRILRYAKAPALQAAAQALNDTLWRDMAQHFHAPTGQLAPPHTRCYGDVLDDRLLTLFEIGTGGACHLLEGRPMDMDLLWLHTTLTCPAWYVPLFAPLTQPRLVQMQYYKGIDTIRPDEVRVLTEKGQPPVTATTWLHPSYCLGSFDRHDMWNQRRPLMAYLQTPQGTTAFRVRCLHDDMDFSSAVISTAQIQNDVAAAIGFVTDHGDYHYILDPLQQGCIAASRFGIRFEMNGDLQCAKVALRKGEYVFTSGNACVCLHILQASLGQLPVSYEIFQTEKAMGLEIMWQPGPDGRIDFSALQQAGVAFSLHVAATGEEVAMPNAHLETQGTKLRVGLQAHGQTAATAWVDTTPATYVEGQPGKAKIYKNGGFLYHE